MAILPAAVMAESANVSGFADISYSNNNNQSLFLANAEVDISKKTSDKVSIRIDTDLALARNASPGVDAKDDPVGTRNGVNANLNGPADSAALEQVYFAYSAMKGVTVLGGVFNNPIGWEKEDAPDTYQITKGQIYGILDGQTALYGNNIAGIAVAAAVGPATVTVAALDEIGLNDVEKNSFAAVINATVMKGLDLELGYVTQESGDSYPDSAGNVLDINATYTGMGLTVGVEYLKPDEAVDSAIGFTANYKISNMLNATVMYDVVKSADPDTDDKTSYALALGVDLDPSLSVAAEYYNFNDGKDDDPAVGLKFIASF